MQAENPTTTRSGERAALAWAFCSSFALMCGYYVLRAAADRGVAVLVNRPFGSGELFDRVRAKPLPAWAAEVGCASWAQFFLKYVLGHPAVTCAIPATANPKHLDDNLDAGCAPLPDEATRRRMAASFEAL